MTISIWKIEVNDSYYEKEDKIFKGTKKALFEYLEDNYHIWLSNGLTKGSNNYYYNDNMEVTKITPEVKK